MGGRCGREPRSRADLRARATLFALDHHDHRPSWRARPCPTRQSQAWSRSFAANICRRDPCGRLDACRRGPTFCKPEQMVDRGEFTSGEYRGDCIGFFPCRSSKTRQYAPAPQESVVGVVVSRSGENWRVDIGSAHMATLDGLAFEGATKRNRPNLKVRLHSSHKPSYPVYDSAQVGSLLYARVSLAHKDMEPELECFDAQTRKAEGFGELKGGFLVQCSLKMCRLCVYPSVFVPSQGVCAIAGGLTAMTDF